MLCILMQCTHLKGTSKKTGKDYDFYNVPMITRSKRFGFPDQFGVDNLALPVAVDFPLPSLCEATFDSRGNLETLAPISSDFVDFEQFFT